MGTKYIYELWEGNKKVDEGLASELKERYFVSCLSTYTSNGALLLGKYRVTKKPRPFYPRHGQIYYYYSMVNDSVVKSYWSDYSGQCMCHYKAGNMFETQDNCRKHGRDLMADICAEFRMARKMEYGESQEIR